MKNVLIASLLALAAAFPATAQDAPAPDEALEAAAAGEAVALSGEAAEAAVQRASVWLESVANLRGRFQQLNPDGSVAEGDFFLQRPGRLRFAYDAPSTLTVLTDGRLYWQIDSALETFDRGDDRSGSARVTRRFLQTPFEHFADPLFPTLRSGDMRRRERPT